MEVDRAPLVERLCVFFKFQMFAVLRNIIYDVKMADIQTQTIVPSVVVQKVFREDFVMKLTHLQQKVNRIFVSLF